MNNQTERGLVTGPAGEIEVALDRPVGASRGVVIVCHPHPLFDGTMDNKVVQTLARAHVQAGWTSWRFNFRGVGRSSGQWDEGRGEIDDAQAVAQAAQASSMASSGTPGCTVAVAGFSFGAFVASQLARRLATAGQPARVVSLIAPAVVNFDVALPLPTPLVVHGSADDVVPLSGVLSWAEEQRGLEGRTLPITVLPGVGHFFHGELGLLKQIVMSHLNLNELSSL